VRVRTAAPARQCDRWRGPSRGECDQSPSDVLDARRVASWTRVLGARGRAGIELLPPVDFAPPVEASMKRFFVLLAVAALVVPVYRRRADGHAQARHQRRQRTTRSPPRPTSSRKWPRRRAVGASRWEVYPAGQLAKTRSSSSRACSSAPSTSAPFPCRRSAASSIRRCSPRRAVPLHGPRARVEGDGRSDRKEMMNRFEPLGAKPFCYGGGWGFRWRAVEQARDRFSR